MTAGRVTLLLLACLAASALAATLSEDFASGIGSFSVEELVFGAGNCTASAENTAADGDFARILADSGAGSLQCALATPLIADGGAHAHRLSARVRGNTAGWTCGAIVFHDQADHFTNATGAVDEYLPLVSVTETAVTVQAKVSNGAGGFTNEVGNNGFPAVNDRPAVGEWFQLEVVCTNTTTEWTCSTNVNGFEIVRDTVVDGSGDLAGVSPISIALFSAASGTSSSSCDFDDVFIEHGDIEPIAPCFGASVGGDFSNNPNINFFDGNDYVAHISRPASTGGYPFTSTFDFAVGSGSFDTVAETVVSNTAVFPVRIPSASAGTVTINARATSDVASFDAGNACSAATKSVSVDVPERDTGDGDALSPTDDSLLILYIVSGAVAAVAIVVSALIFIASRK